jgi:hypothetical protein
MNRVSRAPTTMPMKMANGVDTRRILLAGCMGVEGQSKVRFVWEEERKRRSWRLHFIHSLLALARTPEQR